MRKDDPPNPEFWKSFIAKCVKEGTSAKANGDKSLRDFWVKRYLFGKAMLDYDLKRIEV